MIISERLLFKGLNDELPKTDADRLYDQGHAFAVSFVVGISALLLLGLFIAAG